jgi:hypothetical protein
MRESADSSTQHQRYHVLTAATFSNGDNRNFVHMKVVVDAGYHLHSRFAKTVCGGGLFPACSREVPSTQDAYPVEIVDEWRPGTARLFRARPFPRGG